MRTDAKELFREALIDLVNAQIAATGIRPEQAAAVLAEEGEVMLHDLAWLPHAQRAAVEHFHCARACLVDGRVLPVPGFDVLFPSSDDRDDDKTDAPLPMTFEPLWGHS